MKIILFILSIFIYVNAYTQIVYEEGYIINNEGQKINCYIKNVDWRNNPDQIQYKISKKGSPKLGTLKNIKEFGIGDFVKFARYRVDIDRSGTNLNSLEKVQQPVFKKETIFLKSLVEGKANLYKYVDENLFRYFYNINQDTAIQLVYKLFQKSELIVGHNEYYKHQLANNLKCSDISLKDISSLEYQEKSLINLFVKYDKCTQKGYKLFVEKSKRDLFNLFVNAGIKTSSLIIDNSNSNSSQFNFGSDIGYILGLETEFILPFNKNKWSIFVQPNFQYYNSTKLFENTLVKGGQLEVEVKYKSIEIPVGLKYSLFLNNKSKIFLKGFYVYDFSYDSSIIFKRKDGSLYKSLDISTRPTFGLGLGFNYHSMMSIEILYQTSRQILADYVFWYTKFNSLELKVSYGIL
ncbi:MAG TPA: tRNA modification GTPase [Bacteroidetes bacterium]|nr:tRNA modification GTPase [Bacteroidota bacterium]